mmetsp:Transcript_56111/g.108262  ORF Transcript_56111/g.108262 Transcript_56111/m.108262 type:complete len:498 (+) Transcript_56111:51-1544(+)
MVAGVGDADSKGTERVNGEVGKSQATLALLLSAGGICADIYDFNIINLVRPILSEEFGEPTPGHDSWMTASALMGAIIGQLSFGWLADYMGRRALFIGTVCIVCLGSLGSANAGVWHGFSVYTILGVWRFIMGIGIGGEYPLAAANTSENVDVKSSGAALAFVFAGVAAGGLLGPLVMIWLGSMAISPAMQWRCAFGFGAVLAGLCAVLRYFHLRETDGWRRATRRVPDASLVAAGPSPPTKDALCAMSWTLAGTAGTWFIYDVVTYGVGLFSTSIFPARTGLDSATIVLRINAFALPGYVLAILLAPHVRLKHLLVSATGGMALCFVLLYRQLAPDCSECIWIFSLMRCLDALGPGMVTFSMPAQVFPTRIRATAHGISAAAGKLGAVVGAVAFPYLNNGQQGMMQIMAFMAVLSLLTGLWACVFVPSYDTATLETIAEHDGAPLERQAVLAQRVLFSGDDAPDAVPISCSPGFDPAAGTSSTSHGVTTIGPLAVK